MYMSRSFVRFPKAKPIAKTVVLLVVTQRVNTPPLAVTGYDWLCALWVVNMLNRGLGTFRRLWLGGPLSTCHVDTNILELNSLIGCDWL